MKGMSEFEEACELVDEDYDGTYACENAIEFIKNSKVATVTLSQGRYISKVKSLASKYPDEVKIIREDKGYLVAHLPVKFIKITGRRAEMSEEQRQAAITRLAKHRNNG